MQSLKNFRYSLSTKQPLFLLSAEELQRFGYEKGDTEGLVNQALSVEGVNFAAFIHQSDDRIKISFRSVGNSA